MSKVIDGGSAFPFSVRRDERYMDEGGYGRVRTVTVQKGGMSLRDYFAANLKLDEIQAYLAEGIMGSQCPVRNDETEALEIINWWAEAEAKYRYLQADAMLKAREMQS